MKTVEDVVNIYPDYTWIIFPGDEFTSIMRTEIPLGIQNISDKITLPYCLIWHMSQRIKGVTNKNIQEQIESLIPSSVIPIFCVGPMNETDTLESVFREQLVVLEKWPKNKEIIIAYEPWFAIWTGKTITLEDIEIIYDILIETLKEFKNKSIIYWGSVNDTNIAEIIEITDGVIIGTASQKSSTLLTLSRALWPE